MNLNKLRLSHLGLKASVLWLASLSVSAVHAEDLVIKGVGFATPESVEYAAAQDEYLVTNINGSPFDKDDNGFISRLSPSGEVLQLKWIAGGQNGVTLDAPKGMVSIKDRLYVADIDTVRVFSLPSGKPLADYKIEGSSFLNGICASSLGGVWVTDSGMGPGFAANGKDAIYHLSESGKVTTLVKGEDLGRPNGIVETADKQLVMLSFASGEVYRFDLKGKVIDSLLLESNNLDGLVVDKEGDLIFSSWTAKAILKMKGDDEPEVVFAGLDSPADIDIDTKRNRLLIPSFNGNEVLIKTLP